MRPGSLRLSFRRGCYVSVAALILLVSASGNRGKWELVHNDNFPHAAGVDPIIFNDNDEGWALTWATLYKLRDKGENWTPVLTNVNEKQGFYSFTFITEKTGFVVGTQKKGDAYTVLILQTSDAGASWQERPTDVKAEPDRHKAPGLNSVSFWGDKNGWAVGEDLILHTTDGGQTWQTQRSNIGGDERLFSVACVSSERAWAIGTGGLVLHTSDGGNTWTRQDLGTKDVLMRVRFFGDSGWIVGGTRGRAVLFRTRDGGESWEPQSINVSGELFDIFFLGSQGWIAGESGTILRTNDGGTTWSLEKTPTTENLTSLFFLSPNQGWAGGDRGTLLRFSH